MAWSSDPFWCTPEHTRGGAIYPFETHVRDISNQWGTLAADSAYPLMYRVIVPSIVGVSPSVARAMPPVERANSYGSFNSGHSAARTQTAKPFGTNSISIPKRSRSASLFYEFARDGAPPQPDSFDGALCAIVCHAMAEGRDIRLHGPATRTMLLNLAEFQLAWSRWLPAVYRPVEIEVDTIVTHNC